MAKAAETKSVSSYTGELIHSAVSGIRSELSYQTGAAISRDEFRLMMAEAAIALSKPAKERNSREILLAKTRLVATALTKAVIKGLVTSPSDSKELGSALMSYDQDPSSTLRYLGGTSGSKVERKLSSRELIHAMTIHQQTYLDTIPKDEEGSPIPTLAAIISSADSLGINLHNPPSDEVCDAISGNLDPYNFSRKVSRADAYGNPYSTAHIIDATSTSRTPIGLAAASDSEIGRDPYLEAPFGSSEDELSIEELTT